jgi:RNA polymerase sigma-70 factor, ECF subfamily
MAPIILIVLSPICNNSVILLKSIFKVMETRKDPARFPRTRIELEEFIITCQDRLVNHAFYRLGSRQDAEDVVQDVFVKMFSGRIQNGNINNPVAYAWRMVENACISKFRTRNSENKVPLDEANTCEMVSPGNKEAEIIIREEFFRINKLLGTLPEEQADVIRFRFTDGLTFIEIAGILGLPVTTVKSRFKYGLDKIKTQFFSKKEVINAM